MSDHNQNNNISNLVKNSIEQVIGISNAKVAKEVIKSISATSAAVRAATGLTVAATSGAGITSGLAAAGGVVGGGMAMGPSVLAAGPTYAGAKIINETVFKDQPDLSSVERNARAAEELQRKLVLSLV